MITLEDFINLCNLDGAYCFVGVKEKEFCWRLIHATSPYIGETLDKLEEHYNKIITNVMFYNENGTFSIIIEAK